ncbi:hypothetical protein ND861_16835 [Leptospira sp. 2 VSF19]|uniref:Lipoprotein n=1 Tax=Leptospira soteropolitanensis TaxID=2950025 RepID=A0AAW5VRX2_9LEPT|nr:hypothetical protein [Leptospira soteropolitanensis]MCW7494315.1 hypothetical protein [Leptospira soteropolitanensis]MCW7501976.1 hypothetical protein [Leptospira soteropolitanensis]MCW7524161.1 hypothetical protein [Leptospira soteropolitanensis]MCW7528026.1 hypothetical protein [Leptospira soteropolitanensis]MCW7531880.1 hypothetical protein [Leptospira soteropolitanensis]
MKKITIILILFHLQCADGERQNCRENLDSIEFQKIMALSLLVPIPKNTDQENESRKNIGLVNFVYTQNKAEERKRICDNKLVFKIFEPEANDFD